MEEEGVRCILRVFAAMGDLRENSYWVRPLKSLNSYIQLCKLLNKIRLTTLFTCRTWVLLSSPEALNGVSQGD